MTTRESRVSWATFSSSRSICGWEDPKKAQHPAWYVNYGHRYHIPCIKLIQLCFQHHDFHDNLYCLLRGRKRFVLYPPTEIKHLYPYGKLNALHTNGLISYADGPVRSDGLPVRVALKARVKAIERKLESISGSKGKGKKGTKEWKSLMKAHDEALDELAQYTLEAEDGIDAEDEVDDFDALMAGMGDEEEDDLGGGIEVSAKGSGIEEDDDDDEDEQADQEGPLLPDENDTNNEPPSFSRIPTAFVHEHLNLPTTALPPAGASKDDFLLLQKTPSPFIVDLSPGEMLYLPASWWHEVTSSSSAEDKTAIHMAFNYWFYPPNKLDRFEEPYEDSLVWEYFRFGQKGPSQPGHEADSQSTSSKRKGNVDTINSRDQKRSRR
jgi:hypothetical protein